MKKKQENKKLTLEEIRKRHNKNPNDKDLHKFIEGGGRKDAEEDFNDVLKESVKPSKPIIS